MYKVYYTYSANAACFIIDACTARVIRYGMHLILLSGLSSGTQNSKRVSTSTICSCQGSENSEVSNFSAICIVIPGIKTDFALISIVTHSSLVLCTQLATRLMLFVICTCTRDMTF